MTDDAQHEDEAQDEAEEQEPSAEAEEHHDGGVGLMSLGLERWVQFAFVAFGVVVIYLGDRVITQVWTTWADPDRNVVLGSAVILGIVSAFALYKHKKVNPWAHEVAGELAKVTWPSRKETWYSTIVVIVTSLIAAAYLGAFDALWSAFTDLIYSVG